MGWGLPSLLGTGVPVASRWLAGLLVVSWQPVLAAIRDGQISVVVAALATAAWLLLRRCDERRAGIAVGCATALKVYPGLLVLFLVAHSRRAFWWALATVAFSVAAVAAIAGPHTWVEYRDIAGLIARSFERSPGNLSVLARIAQIVPDWAAVVYPAIAAGMLMASVAVRPRDVSGFEPLDSSFALFATLALLLSPVAWHHYLCLLVQPLVLLLARAVRHGTRSWLAAWCGLLLALSSPFDLMWTLWWRLAPGSLASNLLTQTTAVAAVWAALLWTGASPRPVARAALSTHV
jgi:alpha-1,2-mannosyltransferase